MTRTVTRGKTTGQRIFKCRWSDVESIIAIIFPDPSLSGQLNVIPEAEPFPTDSSIVAHSVKIDPFFPDNIGIVSANSFPATYDFAKLTIDYESPTYNQTNTQQEANNGPGGSQGSAGGETQTFITHKVTVSADFVTWPASALEHKDNSDPSEADTGGGHEKKIPEDQRYAVVIPLIEHNITWHYVRFPPWSAIRWLIGNVNAYWFAGAAPETLLFAGMDASRDVTSKGVQCWTMSYKFLEKNMNQMDPTSNAFGWNHYIRCNGYNAGMFQITDRKRPYGYSTLKDRLSLVPGTIDAGPLVVQSRSSFPKTAGNGFYVRLGSIATGEIIDPGTDLSTTTWTVPAGGRGLFGTAVSTWPVGTPVTSVTLTTIESLSGNLLTIPVPDRFIWPQIGQFFLKSGDEIMVVVQRFASSPINYSVLRGVRGTSQGSPSVGSALELLNSPMYNLGDFRYLFRSGLAFS